MKPFEVRCRWWLPENPTIKVPGVVGFDGTKILAVLDEWVGTSEPLHSPPIETIHAETLDGEPITAFQSFVTNHGSEIRLTTNYLCTGGHLTSLSSQRFDRAVAKINGINEWMSQSPISEVLEKNGSLTIQCSAPHVTSLSLSERAASISIGQIQNIVGGGRVIKVSYDSHLDFVPDSPETKDWFDSLINETCQLLTLFLDQDAALLELSLRPDNAEKSVEWFWNRRKSEIAEIKSFRILIPFAELDGAYPSIFGAWLQNTSENKHSRALLFSHLASPGVFLETRFLPVIQALEVHSRAIGSESKYVPESEFSAIKKTLFEALPVSMEKGLTHKLKTSIGHANEYGLKDRIIGLIDSLDPQVREYVCHDAVKLASRLAITRNFYTHYGDSSGKHLTGNSLHWATEQATLLMKLLFLKQSDVPDELVLQRLKASGWHAQAIEIWKKIENTL